MTPHEAPPPAPSRTRLLLGLAAVFALFHASAALLGSERGQTGLVVAALVVAALLGVERRLFGLALPAAARALGLGRPRARGLVAAAAMCAALLAVVPAYVVATGSTADLYTGWLWLLPGLFAQAGIAEESLFRGYLFRRLRDGRTFWRAATLSMLPFVAVHLLLFATMPWPVAAAALALAVATSFPLAHLFELGGRTIWAPALLHFVVQATVKVVVVTPDATEFALVWMLAAGALPFAAFCWRR